MQGNGLEKGAVASSLRCEILSRVVLVRHVHVIRRERDIGKFWGEERPAGWADLVARTVLVEVDLHFTFAFTHSPTYLPTYLSTYLLLPI